MPIIVDPPAPGPIVSPLTDDTVRTWTIIVTSGTAEDYASLCEDGQEDFCDWSVVAFTPQGWLNFSSYLLSIERRIEGDAARIRYYQNVIRRINEFYDRQNDRD